MRRRRRGGLALALAALGLLTGAAPVRAIRVLEYAGALHGDPPLQQPVSLSLDAVSQSLCVTDNGTRCIDVFDSTGFPRFRTDATSGISSPMGGSIDANGDFVFTDATEGGARTIRRLNFLGEPMDFAPVPPKDGWAPRHLLLTRNGDYVTVDRTALLARHDSTGALLWSLPLADADWEGQDLVGCPTEAPDGTILVPGATLGRVLRVSADGKMLPGFGTHGTKDGELAFPVAVAVGPEGDVLVLDRMRHKILIYDPSYEFVVEYGRLGYRPGELYYPFAMVAAPDGRVFISQGYQGRVQVYRLFDTRDVMSFPKAFGIRR